MSAAETPWMTVPEVVEYARSSRVEILAALNDGSLRGSQKKTGGKWRVHRDAVDAWLQDETVPVPVRRRVAS